MPAFLVAALLSAPCASFVSPFAAEGRAELASIQSRVVSPFGAHRSSTVRGHKHAGVDLKGDSEEQVYAMCPGRVVDIHLAFPHRTVVVEHLLSSGETVYTSYKHLEDVSVKVGDEVGAETVVGRLFSRAENEEARFPSIHLHLEIRRSIEDGGSASWTSMTHEELSLFCYDPLDFLSRHMGL